MTNINEGIDSLNNTQLDLRTSIIEVDDARLERILSTLGRGPKSALDALPPFLDPATDKPWRHVMFAPMKGEFVCSNRARNLVARILDVAVYALFDEDDPLAELFKAQRLRTANMHGTADLLEEHYVRFNPELLWNMNADEWQTLSMCSHLRTDWITQFDHTTWTNQIPLHFVCAGEPDERWPDGNITLLNVETDMTFLQSLDENHMIKLLNNEKR